MTTPKALLILHGKQALNEDVRSAVQARRKQGWELAVRVTWEGGDAQRLVNDTNSISLDWTRQHSFCRWN